MSAPSPPGPPALAAPPPPPPLPGQPQGLTRRARRALIAAGGVPLVAWLVAAGFWLKNVGSHPAGAINAETSADVSAAIVNISGQLEDGTVSGTGMIINSDGTVLTNNHVVAGATALTAQIAGSNYVYQADVVGVDPTQDVAVIRLDDAPPMPTVPIDSSGSLAVGDQVTGLGNAEGLNGSPVSAAGKVTSLDETIQVQDETGSTRESLEGMICFSARIEPGDSGGPLVDGAGRVVGMDTAGSITGTSIANLGWGCAIPITRALAIAHQIVGGVPSPYLEAGHRGVLGVQVADQPQEDGAYVEGVTPNDAAARAGIAPGDLLESVGGIPVHSTQDLSAALMGRRPGDRVTVVWRDAAGTEQSASVTLSAGPPD